MSMDANGNDQGLRAEGLGIGLRLEAPWLVADLARPRRILSYAPHLPGFRTARHVVIREVRDSDLRPGLDATLWLASEMAGLGHGGDPAMMTSRALRHHRTARCDSVSCIATVGLGNAERIGHRRAAPRAGYGTINLVLLIEKGLTEAAQIEALTIAVQARTAAVLDAGIRLTGGFATGTGTDCVALACDPGSLAHAGTHTALGEAIGRATYQAVLAGARDWVADHGTTPPSHPPE